MIKTRLGLAGIGIAILAGAAILAACSDEPSTVQQSQDIQDTVVGNAFEAVPPYQPQQFPSREAINWHLQEVERATVWYVYALNWQGEPVFYIVSSYRPQNVCTGITAPDRKVTGRSGNVVMSAPSLSGVYRGAESCSTFFVRDAATGNLIEISGSAFTIVASTVPLGIETDPFTFEEEGAE